MVACCLQGSSLLSPYAQATPPTGNMKGSFCVAAWPSQYNAPHQVGRIVLPPFQTCTISQFVKDGHGNKWAPLVSMMLQHYLHIHTCTEAASSLLAGLGLKKLLLEKGTAMGYRPSLYSYTHIPISWSVAKRFSVLYC